jgi:hypothetical protein
MPQDEIPLLRKEVRSQVDDLLDRRPVEAQQCVQLSRTNDRRLTTWCGELCSFATDPVADGSGVCAILDETLLKCLALFL